MNARSLLARQPKRPLVIAHRGLAWSYPENTLVSFSAAMHAGADLIELDFQTTSDDHLVCIHDLKLRRYLDIAGHADLLDRAIGSLTLEELRSLDVGTWKGSQHAGVRIPTLETSIHHCAGATLLIERKTGTPRQTLEAIDRCGAQTRVIVQAFDWDYLAQLHALAPDLPIVALGSGPLVTGVEQMVDRLERLRATGATAVHWNDQLTRVEMELLHAERYAIWIYTLNSELTWHGALAIGIDGITTDRADAAAAFVQQHCPRPIPG